MNAKITYRMSFEAHPWNEKSRAAGMQAWCLVKVITPELGPLVESMRQVWTL